MSEGLDLDDLRATYDHPADKSVIELIDRLGQAEQDRVKLRNRLDAMRRQRDGYRNQLRKTEQQIARVREKHSERVLKYPGGAEEHYCAYDRDSAWPCDTIRALDGDGRG